MAKYIVYGLINASKQIGIYEADSKEEAIEKAEDDPNAEWDYTLCHHCSSEVEVGDIYDIEADEF